MRLCLILFAGLSMQGCTIFVWKSALSKDLYLRSVSGEALDAKDTSESQIFLTLSYTRRYADLTLIEYQYAIPLSDGNLPEHFVYSGAKGAGLDVYKDIPKEQFDKISAFRFPETNLVRRGSPIYRARDLHLKGNFLIGKSYYAKNPNQDEFPVNIYRFSDDSTSTFRNKTLILPAKQERFISEKCGDIIGTALLTPFTLATDAFITLPMAAIRVVTNPSEVMQLFREPREDTTTRASPDPVPAKM